MTNKGKRSKENEIFSETIEFLRKINTKDFAKNLGCAYSYFFHLKYGINEATKYNLGCYKYLKQKSKEFEKEAEKIAKKLGIE